MRTTLLALALGVLALPAAAQTIEELTPDTLRSDNPVVDRTGRYVAYQFGFSRGAGARGQGILLLDLQKLAESRK